MTSALATIPEKTFAARITRVHSVVLLLLVLCAAMLFPLAHTAMHGEDLLVRNFVARIAAQRPMTPALSVVARQAAENRIGLQPVAQPAYALLLILTMAVCAWLLCRWRTVRITFVTALRAAALAYAAGMVFYLILYFAGWALLGSSSMMPEWQHIVPTSVADLHIGRPSWHDMFEGFSLGTLARFIAFGVLLRYLAPALRRRDEWIVMASTATLTAVIFIPAMLL